MADYGEKLSMNCILILKTQVVLLYIIFCALYNLTLISEIFICVDASNYKNA